jgi:hypothetical protein
MPRRKAFVSGLLAFGAGVAVGANWPRAGNFVGYILQRLGVELTDLSLWMWDPEESVARTPQTTEAKGSKARKRTPALPIQNSDPAKKKTRAKAKKAGDSTRVQSGQVSMRTTRKKKSDADEPWLQPDRMNGSAEGSSGWVDSPLAQSGKTGIRGNRIKPAGNRAAVNNRKRKASGARRGGKNGTFPRNVSASTASLN